MGWTVRELNAEEGETFCTCPDQPLDPPGPMYNEYKFSFLGVK
jgi:hypothetical protein